MERERKILLSLESIYKSYGTNPVLKNISLEIFKGEFVTLLGSSGCGKTTLLRIIAGFEPITSGRVMLKGEDITQIPPERRRVNTVFQNYALFPHMNVYDNISYGLRIKKAGRDLVKSRVDDMLRLVRLEGFEKRMPGELSGGERQRVAIARALINDPDVLLLDEPLGALDLKLRQHMQSELKQIQKTTETTFIYVTHDQEEALFLSDKIAVMHNRGICQTGSPIEIYRKPSDLYTARFVGERSIFPVTPLENKDTYSVVEFGGQKLEALGNFCAGGKYCLAVLNDVINVAASIPETQYIQAIVTDISVIGSRTRLLCEAGGINSISAVLYNSPSPVPAGGEVYLSFDRNDAVLLKDDEQ